MPWADISLSRFMCVLDWICYGLLDDIIDTFVPLIRAIEFEVDSIDELVLILKESEQSDMLRRIGYCRKKMMSLLRLLVAKSDVIKTLIKRGGEHASSSSSPHKSSHRNNKRPTVSHDVAIYLGDIQGKLQSYPCMYTQCISSRSTQITLSLCFSHWITMKRYLPGPIPITWLKYPLKWRKPTMKSTMSCQSSQHSAVCLCRWIWLRACGAWTSRCQVNFRYVCSRVKYSLSYILNDVI